MRKALFLDRQELHSAIVDKSPADFVSHFIFEPVPFIFNGDLSLWIKWKTFLAGLIDVDPYDIVLTGSASIGYSLNPKKNYKKFDTDSDIDCGIISQHYFELSWRHLRQIRVSWLALPPQTRRAINMHRNNYIFSGTIATDMVLGVLPFGQAWQSALDQMRAIDPTRDRQVNLRIYRDYDSLRQYQSHGIEQLKTQLLQEEDNSPLGIED